MRRGPFEGWILVAWAGLIGVALATLALVAAGPGEEGLRLGLRLTARESWAIFLAVFAAAPLNAARPSRETKWLLRNRRALGVSLATSQAVHLILIVWLATAYPRSFADGLAASTAVGGGLGFVFLALMTATSFDGPAAALGRRAWRALHTAGIWTLFVIFASTYGALAALDARYWVAVAPLLAIAALRASLSLRRRHRAGIRRRS